MKKIIIIGAGMGGLASGIYGQANGFETEIFEQHTAPGGQACSWKRKGFTFDGCLHHFMGSAPNSKIYALWSEVGVNPDEFRHLDECVSFWKDGKMFSDWYDTEKLLSHLLELFPQDATEIKKYVTDIRKIGKFDIMGEMTISGVGSLLKHPTLLFHILKNMGIPLEKYSKRLTDPLLQNAFKYCEYSLTFLPYGMHLSKKSDGANGGITWPPGGITRVVKSMTSKYEKLGGKLNLGKKVSKVITEKGKAIGIQLQDGSKIIGDYVISNADGRKTLDELLENKYTTPRLQQYMKLDPNDTNWAFHVFLGVNRDLSKEPSSLHILLDEPATIAGHICDHLEMQMFGFDSTMAPKGKGVIKVELFSSWGYCENIGKDKVKYEGEKKAIADKVIEILDSTYFKGLKDQVEVIDVPTLLTWARFLNSRYGFMGMPNKKFDMVGGLLGKSDTETLKGLANFRMVGTWATSTGATFANVNSGKKAIKAICRTEKVKFQTPSI